MMFFISHQRYSDTVLFTDKSFRLSQINLSLRFSSCICVCLCVHLGLDHTVFQSRCFPDGTTGVDLRRLFSRTPSTNRLSNRKTSPSALLPLPLPLLTHGLLNHHRYSRRGHRTPLLCSSGTPTTRPYLSRHHARSNGQSGATAVRSQPPS